MRGIPQPGLHNGRHRDTLSPPPPSLAPASSPESTSIPAHQYYYWSWAVKFGLTLNIDPIGPQD